MEREIKFRVWSKESKKMYLPKKGCDFLVRIDGEYFVDEDILENVGLIPVEKDGYVLMQYTGLKDKNGKEIYEGDMVVNGADRYIVEYREGGFNLAGIDDFTHDIYIWFEHKMVEVIGNIYENPELLSKLTTK